MFDAIVIGAGVVGCAVARELSRYHMSVLCLEKLNDISEGSTKANSAIVHAGYDAKPGTNKARYNVEGNAMYEALCKELCVPFLRNTSIVLGFSPEDVQGLEELKARGELNGVPGLHILSQAELRALEPNVAPGAYAALVAPTGAITSPYELNIALAENAAANGVKFRREAGVTAIRRENGRFVVTANGEEIEGHTVINCAGLYADEINNMACTQKYTIHPRRGQYYMIDKEYGGTFHATIFQLPSKMGKGVLIGTTVEGTMFFGPSAEDVDDKDDVQTTAEGLEGVLRVAKHSWDGIPKGKFITAFSGMRAHCNVDDFVIGESDDTPGFFNALGIESPGLTAAPAIAKELAQAVSKKLSASVNESFNPIREPLKKFREMTNEERAEAIAQNPAYGRLVCRCELVSEAEVVDAIRKEVGARTVDGVKRRTRAGMGRCQGGFCLPRVVELLARELGISPLEVSKFGGESVFLTGTISGEDNTHA